jgi:hypothetical protein
MAMAQQVPHRPQPGLNPWRQPEFSVGPFRRDAVRQRRRYRRHIPHGVAIETIRAIALHIVGREAEMRDRGRCVAFNPGDGVAAKHDHEVPAIAQRPQRALTERFAQFLECVFPGYAGRNANQLGPQIVRRDQADGAVREARRMVRISLH